MPKSAGGHVRPFRILTVCTGNVCRSPLAMALLRQDLPKELIEVNSVGIQASPDMEVPDQQLMIAQQLGLSGLEEHRAQPLVSDELDDYDLILGASLKHRRYLVQRDPRIVRKTFTLREFAHLASYVTLDDIRRAHSHDVSGRKAVVEAVSRKRGMVPRPPSDADFDVLDPYGKNTRAYRRSRDQIVPATQVTAEYFDRAIEVFPPFVSSIQSETASIPESLSLVEAIAPDQTARSGFDPSTVSTTRHTLPSSGRSSSIPQLPGTATVPTTSSHRGTASLPDLPKRRGVHSTPLPTRRTWRPLFRRGNR